MNNISPRESVLVELMKKQQDLLYAGMRMIYTEEKVAEFIKQDIEINKVLAKIQVQLKTGIPWYYSMAIASDVREGKIDIEKWTKELQEREERNIKFWDRWKTGEITPENFFQESSWVSITHSNNKK